MTWAQPHEIRYCRCQQRGNYEGMRVFRLCFQLKTKLIEAAAEVTAYLVKDYHAMRFRSVAGRFGLGTTHSNANPITQFGHQFGELAAIFAPDDLGCQKFIQSFL